MKPTLNLRLPFNLVRSFRSPLWTAGLPITPIGAISVAFSIRGLALLAFAPLDKVNDTLRDSIGIAGLSTSQVLIDECLKQLREYLGGTRRKFDIPMDLSGLNAFEERVHRITSGIPFGELRTYGEIAKQLGMPYGSRAVGNAQAHNPLPLFIPCHRVIGSDRKLHGFAAPDGIVTKAWLLRLEGQRINNGKVERPDNLTQLPLL